MRLLTGYDGLYGQDSHSYLAQGVALRDWLAGGGERPPGFRTFCPNFSLALALAGAAAPPAAGGQAVALLALLLAHGAGAWLLLELAGPDATPGEARLLAGYWTVAFALSPFVLRSSLSIMADVPGIALLLLGLVAASRYLGRPCALPLLGTAVALGACFGTRYPLALVALPPLLLVGAAAIRERAWGAIALSLLLGAVTMQPKELLSISSRHPGLAGWALHNLWSRTLTSGDGTTIHALPNAIFMLSPLWHPGFFLASPLLLLALGKSDLALPMRRAVALGLALFTIFAAGTPYQNHRHVMPAFPAALIVLAPAALRIARRAGASGTALALALLASANLAMLPRTMAATLEANALERRAAELLRARPATTLYTFWLAPALATRGIPQRIVDISQEPVVAPRPGELVLFAPERFATVWAGKPVMQGWDVLERAGLAPRDDVGGGFRLFEVTGLAQRAIP